MITCGRVLRLERSLHALIVVLLFTPTFGLLFLSRAQGAVVKRPEVSAGAPGQVEVQWQPVSVVPDGAVIFPDFRLERGDDMSTWATLETRALSGVGGTRPLQVATAPFVGPRGFFRLYEFVNLPGADLSGLDLEGGQFPNALLGGADLSGAMLAGANLAGADLSGADLDFAILQRADLSGANLANASIQFAVLSGSDLSGANTTGSNFSNSQVGRLAPSDVVAIAGDGLIDVVWGHINGATSYTAYLATDPSLTSANYASLAGGARLEDVSAPLRLPGLTNGEEVFIVLTATFPEGVSVDSVRVSAIPSASPPSPPKIIAGTVSMAGRVRDGIGELVRKESGGGETHLDYLYTDAHGRFATTVAAAEAGPLELRFFQGVYTGADGEGRGVLQAAPLLARLVPGASNGVHLTPLTTMAAELAGRLALDNSAEALLAVDQAVGNYFAAPGIPDLLPPDLLQQGGPGGVPSDASLRHGLVLAGLLELASDLSLDPGLLVRRLAQDASDGALDGRDGVSTVAGLGTASGTSDLASALDDFLLGAANESAMTTASALVDDLQASLNDRPGTLLFTPNPLAPALLLASAADGNTLDSVTLKFENATTLDGALSALEVRRDGIPLVENTDWSRAQPVADEITISLLNLVDGVYDIRVRPQDEDGDKSYAPYRVSLSENRIENITARLTFPGGLDPANFDVVAPVSDGVITGPSGDFMIACRVKTADMIMAIPKNGDGNTFFAVHCPGMGTTVLDGLSTAKGLMFMHPSVMTNDPQKAAELLGLMGSLPEIATLAGLVDTKWPTLAEPLDDPVVQAAVGTALNALELAMGQLSPGPAPGLAPPVEEEADKPASGGGKKAAALASTLTGKARMIKGVSATFSDSDPLRSGARFEESPVNNLDWLVRLVELDPISKEELAVQEDHLVWVVDDEHLAGELSRKVVDALVSHVPGIERGDNTARVESRAALYELRFFSGALTSGADGLTGQDETDWTLAFTVNVMGIVSAGADLVLDLVNSPRLLELFIDNLLICAAPRLAIIVSYDDLTLEQAGTLIWECSGEAMKAAALAYAEEQAVQQSKKLSETLGKFVGKVVIIKKAFSIATVVGTAAKRATALSGASEDDVSFRLLAQVHPASDQLKMEIGDAYADPFKVTSILPSQVRSGDTVTVTGENFHTPMGADQVIQVYFGGVLVPSGNVTIVSNTQLEVVIPTQVNAGNQSLEIRAAGRAIPLSPALEMRRSPYLEEVTPGAGFAAVPVFRGFPFPGTTVTLDGFGFDPNTDRVFFGAVQATVDLNFPATPTSMVVNVPLGATVGPLQVRLPLAEDPGDTYFTERPFSVTGPPTLATMSPPGGPRGSLLRLEGTNFGPEVGTVQVSFTDPTPGGEGTVDGFVRSVKDGTALTVAVPTVGDASSLDVVVTTPAGSSGSLSFAVTPGAASGETLVVTALTGVADNDGMITLPEALDYISRMPGADTLPPNKVRLLGVKMGTGEVLVDKICGFDTQAAQNAKVADILAMPMMGGVSIIHVPDDRDLMGGYDSTIGADNADSITFSSGLTGVFAPAITLSYGDDAINGMDATVTFSGGFTLDSDGNQLLNFTVEGAGVLIHDSDDSFLENLLVKGAPGHGIFLRSGCVGSEVRSCTVIASGGDGIRVEGGGSNEISSNWVGFHGMGAAQGVIDGNAGNGIALIGTLLNSLLANAVLDSGGAGILLDDSHANLLSDFGGSLGIGYAMDFGGTPLFAVAGNGTHGLHLTGSSSNSVEQVSMFDSVGDGCRVEGASVGNVFNDCNFGDAFAVLSIPGVGNDGSGLHLLGSGVEGTIVACCFFGGNSIDGLRLDGVVSSDPATIITGNLANQAFGIGEPNLVTGMHLINCQNVLFSGDVTPLLGGRFFCFQTNEIAGSPIGIHLEGADCAFNRVQGVKVYGNVTGIKVSGGAHHNDLRGNTTPFVPPPLATAPPEDATLPAKTPPQAVELIKEKAPSAKGSRKGVITPAGPLDVFAVYDNLGYGLDLEGVENRVFMSNDRHFDNNALGDIIVRDPSTENQFYDLELRSDTGGMIVEGANTRDNVITETKFQSMAGFGMIIRGGAKGTLVGKEGEPENTFTVSTTALEVRDADTTGTRVDNSDFRQAAVGIRVHGGASDVIISETNLVPLLGGEVIGRAIHLGPTVSEVKIGDPSAAAEAVYIGETAEGIRIEGPGVDKIEIRNTRVENFLGLTGGYGILVKEVSPAGPSTDPPVAIGGYGLLEAVHVSTNQGVGIDLDDCDRLTIFGNSIAPTDPFFGPANDIGIRLSAGSSKNLIDRNTITKANTTGVSILGVGSNDNPITNNTIVGHGSYGVLVNAGIRNRISGNSISANGVKGIELLNGGNNEIEAPDLTEVSRSQNRVQGLLANPTSGSKRIELFSDPAAQGLSYLGSTIISNNSFRFNTSPPVGQNATATVTDEAGNTSEFGDLGLGGDPSLVARYVFTSTQYGNAEIHLSDFDPLTGERLTTNVAHDDRPVLSPDGQMVVFVSNRSGNLDLWKVNIDGSGLTQLTSDPADDFDPAISADGMKIAFASTRGGAPRIYKMDVSGANLSAVSVPAVDKAHCHPTWSPDGSELAFAEGPLASFSATSLSPFPPSVLATSLRKINADGTSDVVVLDDGHRNLQPAWGPDGIRLAFATDRDTVSEIYTVETDGTNLTRITTNPGTDASPSWARLVTPSGTVDALLFSSGLGGETEVYGIEPVSGAVTRLSTSLGESTQPNAGGQ